MTDSEPPSPDGAPTGVASASSRVEQARRFADFVRRYRGPLVQYFRKRGLVHSDAEDLMQEVFLRLMRRQRDEAVEISDGYVFSAASSVLIDHHRRRATRGAIAELDQDLADNSPGADKILEDREALRVMHTALFQLNAKLRRAFVLHRFEQLSHAEVAAKLGVSVSTVEKYVMAALERLRGAVDRRDDV